MFKGFLGCWGSDVGAMCLPNYAQLGIHALTPVPNFFEHTQASIHHSRTLS